MGIRWRLLQHAPGPMVEKLAEIRTTPQYKSMKANQLAGM